jgi:hypothetical protein
VPSNFPLISSSSAFVPWRSAVTATARWVNFRLDLICALTLTATALLAVVAQGMVQPQLLDLALSYINPEGHVRECMG